MAKYFLLILFDLPASNENGCLCGAAIFIILN